MIYWLQGILFGCFHKVKWKPWKVSGDRAAYQIGTCEKCGKTWMRILSE